MQGLIQLWKFANKRWRSRHLLIGLTIAATAIAVSATAIFSYRLLRGLILDNLKDNALLQVRQGVSQIDGWLGARKSEVEAIANRPAVRSLNWSVARPNLQLEVDRLPDFHMLVLAIADGSYYTTKTGFAAGKTIRDRRHFQAAMAGETLVDDPVVSRSTGVRHVIIATPIWSVAPFNRSDRSPETEAIRARSLAALQLLEDSEPKPIGEFAGAISVDRLSEVVAQISFGKDSYAFALNSRGEPIVHPDPSLIATQDVPTSSFLQATDPDLRQIAAQMVDKQSNIELVQLGGDWAYVAHSSLNQADWSIALVIPRQNLENGLFSLNLLAVVVGILLAVAMGTAVRLVLASERDRAEAEREALLNRITERIRASLDLDEILQTTVTEVGTLLHLEGVAFCWHDPQQKTLEISYQYGHLATALDLARLTSKNGYLALSVKTQSRKLGDLICSDSQRDLWNHSERELLQAVADQLAIAINQSRLYNQTREQVELRDEALTKLRQTQAHLVQSEKMSSLGQLVAGISHEINNPVNFIYGNLNYTDEYIQNLLNLLDLYARYYPEPVPEIREEIETIDLDFIKDDLLQILKSMKLGTERIRQIVLSLRNFSRLDESERKEADIHEGIENTLLLLKPRLKNKISVVKHYAELPKVECFPGQLNQVFMNLISNSIEALTESNPPEKIIAIATSLVEKPEGKFVRIAIADNGPGISPEIQSKIYDPFFTTKPVGKGTGLGLAISYQIIAEVHGGTICVQAPPLGGAEFIVEIPI